MTRALNNLPFAAFDVPNKGPTTPEDLGALPRLTLRQVTDHGKNM